jgi:hypothetical protein
VGSDWEAAGLAVAMAAAAGIQNISSLLSRRPRESDDLSQQSRTPADLAASCAP